MKARIAHFVHSVQHVELLGLGLSLQAGEPPALEINILAQGIVEGMEMDIDPEGRVFITESKGKVELYTPGPPGTLSELIDSKSDTRGESGLIGIALDPNFVKNQWIYLYHTVAFATKNGDYLEHRLGRFVFALAR